MKQIANQKEYKEEKSDTWEGAAAYKIPWAWHLTFYE